jgi:inhibitor of KinA sporulation pathway (predicted exonuclease)
LDNHHSIKHDFAKIKNIKACGMSKALNILGISLDGTHHRGIDDALNISKIFKAVFDEWRLL